MGNVRFTKELVQKILDLNDNYTTERIFKSKNFRETTSYLIKQGKLFVRRSGKTSWADSRFDKMYELDLDDARKFIKSELLRFSNHLKLPDEFK